MTSLENRVMLCVTLLVQGLKSHAVTMFEVGKLSDESLDSFLAELEKVRTVFTIYVKSSLSP